MQIKNTSFRLAISSCPRQTAMRPKNKKNAFTIIELLVVVTVIAVLVAFLVPAVQSMRETSRRLSCVNSLKQLGIALHGYESSHKVFPRGENGFSPQAMMLPYLEQEALFNSINTNMHSSESANQNETAFNVQLSVLLCPSDKTPENSLSVSSYCVNYGSGFNLYDAIPNGPFSWQINTPGVGTQMIVDGLSQTCAISEWATGRSLNVRDPKRSTFMAGTKIIDISDYEKFLSDCQNVNKKIAQVDSPWKGIEWYVLGCGNSAYNHNLTPNENTCKSAGVIAQGAWTAGSYHPGGINVLFTDGHVAFTKDSISLAAWRALGTMNGHEVIYE